jgi:magnesium chelatase family protein
MLVEMGVLPGEELAHYTVLGSSGWTGASTPSGVLPAVIAAAAAGRGLICPAAQGSEAAWAGGHEAGPPPSCAGQSLQGQPDPPRPSPEMQDLAVHPLISPISRARIRQARWSGGGRRT